MSNFDARQAVAIENHLRKHLDAKKCPVCDASNWSVQDRAFMLVEDDPPNVINTDRRTIPLVVVVCSSCLLTLTFAARPLLVDS